MAHNNLVLVLDMAGAPSKWMTVQEVIPYYVKDLVAWSVGENEFIYRGGIQRVAGIRSQIAANSIIAVRGSEFMARHDQAPAFSRPLLYGRDRHMCAYCGGVFKERDLSADHIHPASLGGELTWANTVTACKRCNNRKGNRLLKDIPDMELLYVPYTPNLHEYFILRNRNVLADQMAYLMQNVPETSRLRQAA